MALAIVALIGTAIAGMMTAVAYGTDSDKDVRALVARNMMLTSRVNAAIRGSRMVLDADADWAVLWTRDLDGNDEPSLLEIRRLEYNATTDTFSSYAAPDGTTDVAYSRSDDFLVITDALMGGATFPESRWADQVEAVSFSYSNADTQLARLMSYRITLGSAAMSDVVIGTVLLRNPS